MTDPSLKQFPSANPPPLLPPHLADPHDPLHSQICINSGLHCTVPLANVEYQRLTLLHCASLQYNPLYKSASSCFALGSEFTAVVCSSMRVSSDPARRSSFVVNCTSRIERKPSRHRSPSTPFFSQQTPPFLPFPIQCLVLPLFCPCLGLFTQKTAWKRDLLFPSGPKAPPPL